MQIFEFVLFVATIASSLAAPIGSEPGAEEVALKDAIAPVANQFRAMLDNTKNAVEEISKEVIQSRNNIAEATKDVLSPIGAQDRANIGSTLMNRLRAMARALVNNSRSIFERALNSFKPVMESQKGLIDAARNALGILENKYLTEDGQNLAKAVVNNLG